MHVKTTSINSDEVRTYERQNNFNIREIVVALGLYLCYNTTWKQNPLTILLSLKQFSAVAVDPLSFICIFSLIQKCSKSQRADWQNPLVLSITLQILMRHGISTNGQKHFWPNNVPPSWYNDHMKTIYKYIKSDIQNGYGFTLFALASGLVAFIMVALDALS